ncbi:uncharacterized protein G2W53_013694 [Senna tora]|uniref:Uncharacterized protein n=1 Tax=Senna tora TaxID=362788 RepID=A0A834U204_9FABA|nr:uncharacterized protein G2W53_013694 [Senna tora]
MAPRLPSRLAYCWSRLLRWTECYGTKGSG